MKRILFIILLSGFMFGQATSLQDQTIGHPDSTFKQLLRFANNAASQATLKQIYDGTGDSTALWLAHDSVKVSGVFTVTGQTTFLGTTINMVTSGTVLTVGVGVDNGTVSAGIFTDRTPFYDGDALAVIKNIKGKDGRIDHPTLPPFVQSHKTKDIFEKKPKKDEFDEFVLDDEGNQILEDVKVGTENYIERNIGNMISVNVKALQQLIAINEDLTMRIEILESL